MECQFCVFYAEVMELVVMRDLKSLVHCGVRVRVPSSVLYLGVAQLVERLLWEQEVIGSSPVT